MSIQSEINRITGEVNTQTSALASIESQLAQALTLLDGKAAGGGGSGGSAVETWTGTLITSNFGLGSKPSYRYYYIDETFTQRVIDVIPGATETITVVANTIIVQCQFWDTPSSPTDYSDSVTLLNHGMSTNVLLPTKNNFVIE